MKSATGRRAQNTHQFFLPQGGRGWAGGLGGWWVGASPAPPRGQRALSYGLPRSPRISTAGKRGGSGGNTGSVLPGGKRLNSFVKGIKNIPCKPYIIYNASLPPAAPAGHPRPPTPLGLALQLLPGRLVRARVESVCPEH